MTKLYLLTTKEASAYPEEYCRRYFPARFERAEKFRFEEDRLRCIGAGILLHEILGLKEEEMETGPHGKPAMKRSFKDSPEFNLSHSGVYILLAVSEHPVGADIERMDPAHSGVAKRVYQPEELSWMKEEPEKRTERFFRLWTLKEAVMKALGRGMSLPPESFSVLPFLSGKPVRVEDQVLYGRSEVLPGYAVGLCSTQEITEMPAFGRIS